MPTCAQARPGSCPCCGAPSSPLGERLIIVGHGLVERQIQGPAAADGVPEQGVVTLRRYRCRRCDVADAGDRGERRDHGRRACPDEPSTHRGRLRRRPLDHPGALARRGPRDAPLRRGRPRRARAARRRPLRPSRARGPRRSHPRCRSRLVCLRWSMCGGVIRDRVVALRRRTRCADVDEHHDGARGP